MKKVLKLLLILSLIFNHLLLLSGGDYLHAQVHDHICEENQEAGSEENSSQEDCFLDQILSQTFDYFNSFAFTFFDYLGDSHFGFDQVFFSLSDQFQFLSRAPPMV